MVYGAFYFQWIISIIYLPSFFPGPESHLSYCRHFAVAVVFVNILYSIISENTEPNYAGVMFVEFLKS